MQGRRMEAIMRPSASLRLCVYDMVAIRKSLYFPEGDDRVLHTAPTS